MSDVWIDELKKVVKGDVELSEKVLDKYSVDASIFQLKPEVVVFPKNSRDVESLVSFINSKKERFPDLSLTARAGGTDMTGGCLSESIVLSFTKYFNKIGNIKAKSVDVEPGVYFRDFEKRTLKKGLIFPTYPASKSICALGGMISNNSGGEKSIHYGKTAEHVLKLKVVLSDGKEYEFKKLNRGELNLKIGQKDFEGQIYREIFNLIDKNYDEIQKARPKVSKNSAGYYLWDVYDKKKGTFDLTQLFTGSQGTLGIITSAELELVKKKKHSRLVVCFLNNSKDLVRLVNLALPYKPESLETFDEKTLKLSMRFMPEIAKKMKANIFSLFFSFIGEAFMVLKSGFPKFVVLVELNEDDPKKLSKRLISLSKRFDLEEINHLVMKSEKAGEKYWTIRRESFNLLRQKVKGKIATPFIDDFAVNPKDLPKFFPELLKILEHYGVEPTLIGHAGSGNFHIIPLMDLSKASERAKIPVVSEKVYSLLGKYNGTITAEHNDGLIRTPYLSKMYSKKVLSLFEKVKDILDPKDIFNPGKKVHGDMKYAMEHIKKKND